MVSTIRIVNKVLEHRINKSLKESGFGLNTAMDDLGINTRQPVPMNILPKEYRSKIYSNEYSILKILEHNNNQIKFLLPKLWEKETVNKEHIMYRAQSDEKIKGVFELDFFKEKSNTNFTSYKSDVVKSMSEKCENIEIIYSQSISTDSICIAFIELVADEVNSGRISFVHCKYSKEEGEYVLNILSDYQYFSYNKDEIYKCIKSLRID
jgi:hypothetical protein